MEPRVMRVALWGAGCVVALTGFAAAQPIISFGFTDLSTSFDINTSVLEAHAVDAGQLRSGGDVSRLVGGGGSADYESGFMSLGTQAGFDLSMSIFNIFGNTAQGSGQFTITDATGDTIFGDIAGDWELIGGVFYVFSGLLDNVFLADNSGDGLFDGPTAGAFSTLFAAQQPYTGASVYLYFGNLGGFFAKSFDDVSGQIAGEIIPSPGAVALLGLAALSAGRRRR